MNRPTLIALLPAFTLLAACGGGGADITVTNENNVVLNEAQANYATTNDGEMPNAAAAADGNVSTNATGGVNTVDGFDPSRMTNAAAAANAM